MVEVGMVYNKNSNKMNIAKYKLLQGWNFIRFLRLVLSIIMLIQALLIKDIFLGVLGVFFLYQVVMNVSCCSQNACTIEEQHPSKNKN